jgi:arsenate reductase (glutaredoxin)
MVRIYHNSRCSKSRATLALLEQHGGEVEMINYLDHPPSAAELGVLLKQLGMTARQLLRAGEAEYESLGLEDPALDAASLIAAMVAHPKLIERAPTHISRRGQSGSSENASASIHAGKRSRCASSGAGSSAIVTTCSCAPSSISGSPTGSITALSPA